MLYIRYGYGGDMLASGDMELWRYGGNRRDILKFAPYVEEDSSLGQI